MAIISIQQTAANLGVAIILGAAIGFERQWHQRLAGLRTNTLVALGAATFVVFESLFPDTSNPTHVAAQVVSGIGFLGAGMIFRDGLNVRGLNTAATLWCSAAVGILSGAGAWMHAALAATLVVGVNLLLRPLVQRISQRPMTSVEMPSCYIISVTCKSKQAAPIRALVLQELNRLGLHLRRLDSANIEGTDHVEVTAAATAEGRPDGALEQIVGRLSLEPTVTAARWRVEALVEQ
jgi:putative Mg2+ transporter-C (MgtC) family protein